MSQQSSQFDFSQLSASGQFEVDAFCNHFESEWSSGSPPRIRDYLTAAPDAPRAAVLFRELLRIELERRRSSGDAPGLGEYLPEFSEFESIVRSELDRVTITPARDTDRVKPIQRPTSQDSTIVEPIDPGAIKNSADTGDIQRSIPLRPSLTSRYQLGVELARGGMGVVHRATDLQFRREVAIKLLRPHWEKCLDPVTKKHALAQAVEMFRYEAEITARLQHPGIPPVHELGDYGDDNLPFLAMKLIQGRTLQQLLDARKSPQDELPRWLQVFEQVAQAVGYAHSQGILHRDLKPLNVMVGEFGEVQVMDWGLAKILGGSSAKIVAGSVAGNESPPDAVDERLYQSQRGEIKGTLQYMSPEQAQGEINQLDPRTDVFGLGAILCHILTGSAPYAGLSGYELQSTASAGDLGDAEERLRTCGADGELIELALRCLARKPIGRPAHGTSVAASIAAHRASMEERLKKAEMDRAVEARARIERAKRRWMWIGLAALLVCITGGALFFAYRERYNSRVTLLREDDVLALANNLANHESAAGNHKVALQLYERSLNLRRLRFGNRNPRTIDAMINLAKEYHKTRQFEKALALELELLPLAREFRGPHDRFTLNTINNIGSAYYQTKRFNEALPHYMEALELRENHLGKEDPDTMMSYNNLGNVYFDLGRFKEARERFDRAYQIAKKSLGAHDPNTVGYEWSLAQTEQELKNWRAAEKHFLDAYESTAKFNEAKERCETQLKLVTDIIKFYEAWEKPAEVQKWQTELVKQTLKRN